jgi:competence protein ComEC
VSNYAQWLRDLQTSGSRAEIRFLNASKDCENENNDSLVVLVRYGNTKLLVTGAAEWESDSRCQAAIPRMLARYASGDLMDIDIYKVGHHGSRNATNTAYLRELTPRISLISAGHHTDRNADNLPFTAFHYGHPRKDAVDQIIAATTGSRPAKQGYVLDRVRGNPININLTKAIYCTCWDGDIVIPTNSSGSLLPVQVSN